MKKSIKELKEKAKIALSDPKLIEITKNAPINPNGKVNLTQAYEQAFGYRLQQTQDLQKSKKLAIATRWLAMLRRDYEEDFLKLISKKEKQEPKPEGKKKKTLKERTFQIPNETELITKKVLQRSLSLGFTGEEHHLSFRQLSVAHPHARHSVWQFSKEILEALVNSIKAEIADEETQETHTAYRKTLSELLKKYEKELTQLFETR